MTPAYHPQAPRPAKSTGRVYFFRNPATGAIVTLEDVDGMIERHLARRQAEAVA